MGADIEVSLESYHQGQGWHAWGSPDNVLSMLRDYELWMKWGWLDEMHGLPDDADEYTVAGFDEETREAGNEPQASWITLEQLEESLTDGEPDAPDRTEYEALAAAGGALERRGRLVRLVFWVHP